MYKKGAIVLTPFPFTDLSGSKVRPALIVSNLVGDDIVLLFLSSNAGKAGKFDVVLKPSKINNLKVVSVVKCSKIATLEKKIVLGELGEISSAEMKLVNNNLKKILGL